LWTGLWSLVPFLEPGSGNAQHAVDVALRARVDEAIVASTVHSFGPYGPERYFPNSQRGYLLASSAAANAAFHGRRDATFWVFGSVQNEASGRRMLGKTDGTSPGDLLLGSQSTRRTRVAVNGIGASATDQGRNWPAWPAKAHIFAVVRNGQLFFYTVFETDGFQPVLEATIGTVGNSISWTSGNALAVGGKNGVETDTGRNHQGTIVITGMWTRALSIVELQTLVADPFALIRPNWDYLTTAFSSASLLATATHTVADVVNELDNTTDLHLSVDDDPAAPDDDNWVNNAVDVT
jgi:hypothetical protein